MLVRSDAANRAFKAPKRRAFVGYCHRISFTYRGARYPDSEPTGVAANRLAEFMREMKHNMLFSISSSRLSRAALITFLWGGLLALAPLAALATGTVTLAWDPSPGTNAIASYNLYYGVASATYTNVVSAGTNTTASVSNLVEGATYYFAATAVDINGLESDYSTEVSTLIPVKLTNQPPTLNPLANITINESAGLQTVNLAGITSGATNEVQTLTVTTASSNPALIPTPAISYTSPNTTGSIAFTPVAFAYGSATITVTVNDGGTSNNIISRIFAVTVNPVNQPPTLNALANVTINESAGLQTVNLSGITSGASNEIQKLTVTASSSNTGLIPTPTVSYTSPNASGSITFTPVALAYGSATITVTVNDSGTSNNVVSRTFMVTVNPVNQPPTLSALANVTINESAGLQTVNLAGISSGAANEVQTLTATASSSNPALIPTPTVNYTSSNAAGSITFTPVALAYGSATITVTVNDGGTSNNIVSQSFTVIVNPVNQPPTLNALADVAINENSGLQTVNLAGISSGAANENQPLAVTASSSNTGLIPTPTVTYTSPNATGSIRFTPVASAYGLATITVTVNDGGTSNNVVSRSFTVTVNQVVPPPTISSITNLVIAMDSATAPIPFIINSTTSPAANLILSGSSDNPTLVLPADIVFGGAGSNRTATVTPEPGQTGLANITLTVSDGTNTANSVFLLTVRQRPAAPGNLRIAGIGP